MNSEIVIKDKFIDYSGKEHQFIVAGVKIPLKGNSNYDEDDIELVQYALGIGVSICNPLDLFDEKIGTLKAIGRAYKYRPVLYSLYSGQLNEEIIKTVVQEEIKYIKKHPEKYIKGYLESQNKFFEENKLKEIESNFTDIEKVVVEGIKKDPKYLDNISEYITLWKKCGKKG